MTVKIMEKLPPELQQKIILNFTVIAAINFLAMIIGMLCNQRFNVFNIENANIGFWATLFALFFSFISMIIISLMASKTIIEPLLVIAIGFLTGFVFDMILRKNISDIKIYNELIPAIQMACVAGFFSTLFITILARLFEIKENFYIQKLPFVALSIGYGVTIIVLSNNYPKMSSLPISLMIIIMLVLLSYKILTVFMSSIPKAKLEEITYEGVNFANIQTFGVLTLCVPLAFLRF